MNLKDGQLVKIVLAMGIDFPELTDHYGLLVDKETDGDYLESTCRVLLGRKIHIIYQRAVVPL